MKVKYESVKGIFFKNKEARTEKSTVTCECGEIKLFVNFIDSPYTGGYLKITCPTCNAEQILLDDYA